MLPLVYLLAAIGGVCYAAYLKRRRRPEIYAGIASDTMRQILIGTAETKPGAELGPDLESGFDTAQTGDQSDAEEAPRARTASETEE